jgi:esterase/lipase superfamily enzyme
MTRIYFASNRNVLAQTSVKGEVFGERFNADGPQCFRVGFADVTPGSDPAEDKGWKAGKTELYPENLAPGENKETKLGSARMFEQLRVELKNSKRDVIVFLHGFANDFPNALIRAAQLEALYRTAEKDVMVILFSWPSNGRAAPAWEYFSDREDAEASGIAMGRALMRLVEFLTKLRDEDFRVILAARRADEVPNPDDLKQCTRRLHVLAHSMGNWALRHAIQKFINLSAERVPRVFDCAFLMAADEDNDALHENHKLKPLDQLANRVFVYHARGDIALTISDTTKGNPDRLGSDGPQNFDKLSERVIAVDCNKVRDTTLADGRHQYYRKRIEVIEDVKETLADVPQVGRKGRVDIRPGQSWGLIPARG